jgi:hypothetical protein
MVALLSASRLRVWRRCHVDACSLRILFTGKMLATTKKASRMPETVIDEYSLESARSVGDMPIHESLGAVSRNANLSGVLAFRPSDWMAEGSYLSAREG